MSGANRYDKHARPGKHDSHRKHTKHTTYRYPDGATRPSASNSASHSREEPVRQSGTDGATQKSQPGFGSNTAEDVVFNNVVNDVGGVREMILGIRCRLVTCDSSTFANAVQILLSSPSRRSRTNIAHGSATFPSQKPSECPSFRFINMSTVRWVEWKISH